MLKVQIIHSAFMRPTRWYRSRANRAPQPGIPGSAL